MARLFNGVSGGHMAASGSLGLNGLTEMSAAVWLRPNSSDQINLCFVICKQLGAISGNATLQLDFNASCAVRLRLRNVALNQVITWTADTPLTWGTWTRILFTYKRNALNVTDGIWYFNGNPVTSTLVIAGSYTGAFVLEEDSNNWYYGLRPVTLDSKLLGALAHVTIWNRQLTPTEANADFYNHLAISQGLVHRVPLCDDRDYGSAALNMSVVGTVPCEVDGMFGSQVGGAMVMVNA
jgi:hypothetical protein